MTPYLTTSRLALRPIDAGDAENLYALNRDPEVMRYLGPEFKTLEEARAILPKVVKLNERYAYQLGTFAAIDKTSGDFVGWFILRPDWESLDDTKNLEIGYRLLRRFWGMGLGTEGAQALLTKARDELGATRIYAEAMPDNHASVRILEKIGLRFEKTVVETDHGTPVELVVYSRRF